MTAKFKAMGLEPCERCKALAVLMNIKGPQWCINNAKALAAKIDGNLRHQHGVAAKAAKLTPGPIRRAWIKRQIIKAARNQ